MEEERELQKKLREQLWFISKHQPEAVEIQKLYHSPLMEWNEEDDQTLEQEYCRYLSHQNE
jgi:CTD kinase subunit gamma CTK3 C-terminus